MKGINLMTNKIIYSLFFMILFVNSAMGIGHIHSDLHGTSKHITDKQTITNHPNALKVTSDLLGKEIINDKEQLKEYDNYNIFSKIGWSLLVISGICLFSSNQRSMTSPGSIIGDIGIAILSTNYQIQTRAQGRLLSKIETKEKQQQQINDLLNK